MLLAGQAGAAPRLAVTTPLPEMVATLNGFQPEALTAYPSVAAALAEEQLQGWARPGGWTRSTSTGPPRPSWSPPGARGRTAMDVLEDLVVVEVADRRGRPVAPGVPGHKALLTSLVSRVQPLLRYELTDSVTVAEGPNPLGLPYARIAAVDGRSDDIVTLPAPGGGRVAVHRSRSPTASFAELLEVRQYQVARGPDGLRVAVVLRESAPADTPARIRAALARELGDAGAVPSRIEVTPVPGSTATPATAPSSSPAKLVARRPQPQREAGRASAPTPPRGAPEREGSPAADRGRPAIHTPTHGRDPLCGRISDPSPG